MITKQEIKKNFDEIKHDAFQECCLDTKLRFARIFVLGFSLPFIKVIIFNYKKNRRCKLSRNEIIGVLAHELSHQVSYYHRNFW